MKREEEQPIFLLGTGRCGSTFVQKYLCSLPGVWVWGEHAGFLGRLLQWRDNFKNQPLISKFSLKGRDAVDELFMRDHSKVEATEFAWLNGFDPSDIDRVVENAFQILFSDSIPVQNTRWGFKEIRYGHEDDVPRKLIDFFPRARIIHLIRDPYETIESSIFSWHYKLLLSINESKDSKDKIISLYNGYLDKWTLRADYFSNLENEFPENLIRIKLEEFSEKINLLHNFLQIKSDSTFNISKPINFSKRSGSKSNEIDDFFRDLRQSTRDKLFISAEKHGYII